MYEFIQPLADFIGLTGVFLTLLAYYLLNMGRLQASSLAYLLTNLAGACLLLVSLLFHWNLSSVIIEIAWISISLLGLYRCKAAKNKQ